MEYTEPETNVSMGGNDGDDWVSTHNDSGPLTFFFFLSHIFPFSQFHITRKSGKEKDADIAEIVSKVSLNEKKQPAKTEDSDDEDIPDISDADFEDNVIEEEDPVRSSPSLFSILTPFPLVFLSVFADLAFPL
jgi:hypothetical protein